MSVGQINLLDLQLPLAIRPSSVMTDDELMRFSERNKPYRIECNRHGEITVMTPLGGIGGTNEIYVSFVLMSWAELTGSGIAFSPSTGFRLQDGSCLSPDGSWIALERWNDLTPAQQRSFPPLCPEFVIEVRSHSDSRRMCEEKMQLWLENGAELAWLVDPLAAEVVIYRQNEEPETLVRPEIVYGSGPVQGFTLRASRLWAAK